MSWVISTMRSSMLHRFSYFAKVRLLLACSCLLCVAPASHAASNDATGRLTVQANVVPVIENNIVPATNGMVVSSGGTGSGAFVVSSGKSSQIPVEVTVRQVSLDESQGSGLGSSSVQGSTESTLQTTTFVEK